MLRLMLAAATLLMATAAAYAGEVLYNGITLPDEWPPRDVPFERFQKGEPAPTPPYLLQPPKVVPIDVGRQLFVDDFLIESSTLTRTFHRPEYYEANPVLKPNMPWETHSRLGPMAMPFSGGVFWDPAEQLFVNASCPQGSLRVEVLDERGQPIAPYLVDNSDVFHSESTLAPIRWKGAADLSPLAGRTVRFRFHIENGSLYSFWVSPKVSGASYGYVAAGGPGFTSNRDTVGKDTRP